MKKGGLLPILNEINQYLMNNNKYEITEADYKMCIRVFGKINERYDTAKTKETINFSKAKSKLKVSKTTKKKNKGNRKSKSKGAYDNGFQKKVDEPDLDGSKGYHKIRENGRFGSHSMYDNMGDESMP